MTAAAISHSFGNKIDLFFDLFGTPTLLSSEPPEGPRREAAASSRGHPSSEGVVIARDQIIVGVDVGSTKVCTLIADVANDEPEILGVGICPSQGMRKGVVIDVQAAANAVLSSLHRAEQQSGS